MRLSPGEGVPNIIIGVKRRVSLTEHFNCTCAHSGENRVHVRGMTGMEGFGRCRGRRLIRPRGGRAAGAVSLPAFLVQRNPFSSYN